MTVMACSSSFEKKTCDGEEGFSQVDQKCPWIGMVRSKNVVSVIKQSVVILALISVQWVLFGYSLAFGNDIGGGLLGGLGFFGLKDVGYPPNPTYAPNILTLTYMIFQAMFAIITPAP